MKRTVHFSSILSTFVIAMGATYPVMGGESETWSGTLYRNGGYFGDANSDERLEGGQASAKQPAEAMVNTVTPKAASPYIGTSFEYYVHRYRNGGNYGDANSDEPLEREAR